MGDGSPGVIKSTQHNLVAIHYSRGRCKTDAYPEQRTAASFDEFIEAVLSDRSALKGLTYICGPFAKGDDGKYHRCSSDALERRFLAVDLDGSTPESFRDVCTFISTFQGVGYRTSSYTNENPRARFILALSRPVNRKEAMRLGAALQHKIEERTVNVKFDASVYRGEQPVFTPLLDATVMHYSGVPADVDLILKEALPADKQPRASNASPTTISGISPPNLAGPCEALNYLPEPKEVAEVLTHISPDVDHDTWLKVGMALHSLDFGELGLQLWNNWSRGSEKYQSGEPSRRWASFKIKPNGITSKTLFDIANKSEKVPESELAPIRALMTNRGWVPAPSHTVKPHRAPPGTDALATASGAGCGALTPPTTPAPPASRLHVDGRNKPISSLHNVVIVLQAYPDVWKLSYNEFSKKLQTAGQPLTDKHIFKIRSWLETEMPRSWSREHIIDGVFGTCHEHPVDPLRDYLGGLRWDGVKRVDLFLSQVYRVEDSPLNAAIGRAFLIQAAARGLQPGSDAHGVLLIIGRQGIGKSRSVRYLSPDPDWHSDSAGYDLNSKDAMISLEGKWLIEFPEMVSFRHSDQEAVKAFITRRIDSYRTPYGTMNENYPRRCVFVTTTNNRHPLHDETGDRRYWPLFVNETVDTGYIREHRDQLWAEAVAAYRSGENWVVSDTLLKQLLERREDAFNVDELEECVIECVERHWPSGGEK